MKFALSLVLLLSLGILGAALGPAAGVSYEIYTMQSGDTRENLASRWGLSPEAIIGLDSGPWQAGKQVAVCRNAPLTGSPTEGAQLSPTPAGGGAKLAWTGKVVRPDCDIRSSKGDFFYRPEVGSILAVVDESKTHYGIMMSNRTTGWIEKSALALESRLPDDWMTGMLAGDGQVVSEAFRYLGLPYRYGGSLPYDIDCSLLVQTVYRSRGVNLPRTAAAQSQVGMAVSLSEAVAGDRLYFVNSRGEIGHAGIYIGGGRFIHASSRQGCVAVSDLAGSYLRTLAVIRR
jgi:cell wall-associated NlpC family hydrolase